MAVTGDATGKAEASAGKRGERRYRRGIRKLDALRSRARKAAARGTLGVSLLDIEDAIAAVLEHVEAKRSR